MVTLGRLRLAAPTLVAFGLLASAPSVPAATFNADAGSLGAIPDGPMGPPMCWTPGAARDVTFTVSGLDQYAPSDVAVSFTLSPVHTYAGDLEVTLIAPDSAAQTIFSRTQAFTAQGCGDNSLVSGSYTFSDSAPASPSWWQQAGSTPSSTPIPSGSYRASTPGGEATSGANTLITPAFAGVTDPNGTWTLRFRDGKQFDTGSVSAAALELTVPPPRTLAVTRSGAGSGEVRGTGIACGSDCTETYAEGTSVTLTATPDAGSTFAGWTGCDTPSGSICQETMDGEETVSAAFAAASTPPTPIDTEITKKKVKAGRGKATFKFTGSGGSGMLSYECKLDGKPFKGCSSPARYRKLKPGKHKFSVRARDATGAADVSPAKVRFKTK